MKVNKELIALSRAKGFMSKDKLVKVSAAYYPLWMFELKLSLLENHNLYIDIVRGHNLQGDYISKRDWFCTIKRGLRKNTKDVESPVGGYHHQCTYLKMLERGLMAALEKLPDGSTNAEWGDLIADKPSSDTLVSINK